MRDEQQPFGAHSAGELPREGARFAAIGFTQLVGALDKMQNKTAAALAEQAATHRDSLLADTALDGLSRLTQPHRPHLGNRRRASFHGLVAETVNGIRANETLVAQDNEEPRHFTSRS